MDVNEPAAKRKSGNVTPEMRASRERLREVNARMSTVKDELKAFKAQIADLRISIKKSMKDSDEQNRFRETLKQIIDKPKELRREASGLRGEKRVLRKTSKAPDPASM